MQGGSGGSPWCRGLLPPLLLLLAALLLATGAAGALPPHPDPLLPPAVDDVGDKNIKI